MSVKEVETFKNDSMNRSPSPESQYGEDIVEEDDESDRNM
jgi:hypothetical protein